MPLEFMAWGSETCSAQAGGLGFRVLEGLGFRVFQAGCLRGEHLLGFHAPLDKRVSMPFKPKKL